MLKLIFLSQLPGLTKETALALRQTCTAMPGLCRYLLNRCDFKYVLMGKIQSDNIEGRFSYVRQLSGANYYISMRQLHESERKLRTISLLKYSCITLTEITEAAKAYSNTTNAITLVAKSIQAELLFNVFPNENDAAIIFYVCGYCCRSLVKSNKCNACKEAIVEEVDKTLPIMDENVPPKAIDFYNEINRGGLWKPTADIFNIGILCWKVFAEISMTELKQKLLRCDHQRDVFKKIVNISFYDTCAMLPWSFASICSNGHDIIDGIAMRFFNCMCKNLVRDLNESESSRAARKIRKLCCKRNAAQ